MQALKLSRVVVFKPLGGSDLYMRPPLTHRLAFVFAENGWRGSQVLWKVATILQKAKEGENVRLPNGFPLLVDSQDWISKTIYEGTYERALIQFLDGLALNEVYVDVGANIGVTLWHSLKGSASTATFMVFEPSAQCYRALGNTRSDIKNQGQIFDFAIGETDEMRTIFGLENQAHSGAATLAIHPGIRGESGEVQVHKLDTVLREHLGDKSISLLKIDTEGYEAQVVMGARETLLSGKVEIIVMEVSPNFGSVDFLNNVDVLLGEKYSWFNLGERGRVKKSPYLLEISLGQALKFRHQWNLVMVRKDVLEMYQRNQDRIAIELLK